MEPRVFRINVRARTLFGGFIFIAGLACFSAALGVHGAIWQIAVLGLCGLGCLAAGWAYFGTARDRVLVLSAEGISELDGVKPRWSYGWDDVTAFSITSQAGYTPRLYALKLRSGQTKLIDGFYSDQIKLAAAIIDNVDRARFQSSHRLKVDGANHVLNGR